MKSSPPKPRRPSFADGGAAAESLAGFSPRETPTRPSMQAVRLAEEERLASSDKGEVSQARRRDELESGVVAAAAPVDPAHNSPTIPPRPTGGSPSRDSAKKLEVSQVARRLEKKIPRMLVRMNEILNFPIDPRSAFLLGYVDGSLTVEELVDLCGIPSAEALDLIDRLQRLGVIALG